MTVGLVRAAVMAVLPVAGAANPATGQPQPCWSVGVDINCAVIGFTAKAPTALLAPSPPRIDNAEIIDTVHARRAPMISANNGLSITP